MLLVARKNLFSEWTRLVISVGGVALSVFLISLLLSLYRGWDEKVGGFVEHSNVDLWLGSEGAEDFLTAASLLPTEGKEAEQAKEYLNAYPSIDQWSPMIVRLMQGVRVDRISATEEKIGSKIDIHFIGFDPNTRLGGPIEVIEGRDTPGPGEVIIDEKLGDRHGIGIGDTLRAGGRDWTVVGKSRGGDFIATQTVFVSHAEAQAALRMQGATTFYVIKVRQGVDPAQLGAALEDQAARNEAPIVTHTREEFAKSTRDRVTSNVLPILFVVLGLAFIVGVSVAGLTIYTATIEKAREYGILKAVGFRNTYLYRVVFEQSAVTALLGFAVGIGLTVGIGPFASDYVPQFVLFTRWQDVLLVAGVTVVMALIAAYIPVRRLGAIDPVSVFKG
ncbi:MAG: ABC transporter permease [Chloroflexi bacterium]|jgi:putative ABC transport system permease protein|nr:MAG: ABC transporter permease [Chloroflexota bacterium]